MRRLVTVVLVGGLSFSVWLLNGGTIAEQVTDAADAGISPPNRDATCPVRLDPDFAADAGLSVYQRAKFPVNLTQQRDIVALDGGLFAPLPDGGTGWPLPKKVRLPDVPVVLASYAFPDGGVPVVAIDVGDRDITLPPMPRQRVRDALDVVDWNDCTLAASTGPVAALWGTAKPFTLSGVVRPWCRQAVGKPCLLTDGGTFGFGNVGPCAARANPATCERVSSGVIFFGDDEVDL